MLYTIENEKIKVSITDMGAELMSIVLKEDNTEYLWQGDAKYWSGRAYNLFPICGRLTDGKYKYKGQIYEMNLHGFARKSVYEMIEDKGNSISFRLAADAVTMDIYPFDFELILTYTLKDTSIITTFNVSNLGEDTMYFALGGHPGFNVPLKNGESFEDYYIEFDDIASPKSLVMSDTCYFLNKYRDFPLEGGKRFSLKHSLFDNDAIFLTEMSKGVTLKSHKSGKAVHLCYPDMKFVGFWHAPKTEAPYVCIEPWRSIPADNGVIDDLEIKREMLTLDSGKTYTTDLTITIA